MYAVPYATKRNMTRVVKGCAVVIVLMIVLMIANFWFGNKTLERVFVLMASASNMIMLVSVCGAHAEARYWRWRSKHGFRFEDPKEKLTQDGHHMIVGVRWDVLNPEVVAWCREQCKGSYGVVPWIGEFDIGRTRTIWFANGDDAFHFKMRWL